MVITMKLPYVVVAIDLETNSTDKNIGSILELGAVIMKEDLTIAREFKAYVKPLDSYWSAEAEKVNGLTREFIDKNGKPLAEVLMEFERWTAGERILGAWGTYFDVQFLRAQYEKIKRPYPFEWRDFDLKTVAMWELGKRGKATMRGVEHALKQLGLTFEGEAHSALDDIKNCVRILQHCAKE